jgi:hypothetical protein
MSSKIKALPELTLEEIEKLGKDSTCIVCQFPLEKGKLLKCGHVIHMYCLKRWIANKSECPTCKDPVTIQSLEASINGYSSI